MKCPNCKNLLLINPLTGKARIVFETLEKQDNDEEYVYRTKRCLNCKETFKTREEIIEKNIH